MIEIKNYKNIAGIPPGRYANRDMTHGGKIFAKTNGDDIWMTNDFTKLRQERLSRDIYFKPSCFPLISPFDYRAGSCFKDWYIIPASHVFEVSTDIVNVSIVQDRITLDQYKKILHKEIIQALEIIFNDNDRVYLHYSGGIDSIVILSCIMRLGMLKKTHLITYHNQLMPNTNTDNIDPELTRKKTNAINQLVLDLKHEIQGHSKFDIEISDLIRLANTVNYDQFVTYCTHTTMLRFHDGAHVGGHYGNQSLLHWHFYVDDLLLQGRSIDDYTKSCQGDVYSKIHVTRYFDSTREYVPIHLKNLLFRYRNVLNQQSPGYHYVLMNETIAQALRKLDLNELTFDILLDAKFARDLIHDNAGNIFDPYIISDGVGGDSLYDIDIPVDLLDPALFQIYKNVNHDPEGREWHNYEIDRMRRNRTVPLNTVVSFKAIQMLDLLVQGKTVLASDSIVNFF